MRLRSSEQLASIMRDRGLTHRSLAAEVGVHRSFVDHLVAGRKSGCSPTRADAMVRTLRCTMSDLFETES